MVEREIETVATDVERIPRKQRGLTTVEYAVAGGLIVVGIIGIFTALGGQVGAIIQSIIDAL